MSDLALPLRPTFDIPRRGRIDGENRLASLFHGSNRGIKRRFDGKADAEAEDGVDDKVSRGQGGGEVLGEWNREILELCDKAGEELGGGLFRIVDRRGVAVVVEMAGADEAITAWGGMMCEQRLEREKPEGNKSMASYRCCRDRMLSGHSCPWKGGAPCKLGSQLVGNLATCFTRLV